MQIEKPVISRFWFRVLPQGAFFMHYTVYILYSALLNKYYTGCCEDLDIRIQQHNAGRNKSTKAGIPWSVKYQEKYQTLKEARAREASIKKMKSRKYIDTLINQSS
ncbi:MAG: GIY-YIG nuclease family protein [Sediminibacterium sp.]